MPRAGESTQTELILEVAGGGGGGERERVGALRSLPDGMTWLLSQFQMDGKAMRYVVLGAWSGCQIVIDHRSVSRQHCIVESRPSGEVIVHDCGSRNGTWINRERVQTAPLLEGSLLSVGEITLLACNKASQSHNLVLSASNVRTFINNALVVYGSVRKAAQALGVSTSTLQGWKKTKFRRKP